MAILNVNGVGKDFGDVTVLEAVTFELQPGQRVGIVGDNGSGKTTLIKLISGEHRPDRGSVKVVGGARVGVLDQIPVYDDGVTVEAVLREAFDHLARMRIKMETLEKAMASGDESGLREYGELTVAFEAGGGYEIEVELKRVANGLGIANMLNTEFNRLSGGERTRINLARMILTDVSIMLLDEPTNHLDIPSTEWLEEYLNSYKGAALIISHDRYFLDRTVVKILEMENLGGKVWEGNYSAYAYQKEEYIKTVEAQIKNADRKARKLEETAQWMRDIGGKDHRKHIRARNMERRAERLRRESPTMIRVGKNLKASFGEANRPGDDMLAVTGLTKSFGDRVLFSEVDLEIKKDDRIALIGGNGTGKTTLLRILLGEEPHDAGRVKWGVGVKHAYLPQHVHFEHENTTLVDSVARTLSINENAARAVLGHFKFSGEDVYKIVKNLSGGEKSRLRLCLLMQGGVNLLILDEPTNHLDIRSREWIEQAMDNFGGTLLMVSHDRYFIEKFATRIWSVEQGGIIDFGGSYDEFKEHASRLKAERERVVTAPEPQPVRQEQKRTRETDALRKRIPIVERSIARLEEHVVELDRWINEAASDHVRLAQLLEEKVFTEQRLGDMMSEWAEMVEEVE